MRKVKYPVLAVVAMSWLLVAPLQAALSSKPDNTVIAQPRVDLAPQDVVGIVINALARNDQPFPDAGIATTFAFASPGNKTNTGPLERFTHMVKSPPYGIMVNHVTRDFSEVVETGNTAYQLVKLTGLDGREVVFAFRLSKQFDGQFKGMWMTDAVWPVSNAGLPGQAL
jgi:hypothetical protein